MGNTGLEHFHEEFSQVQQSKNRHIDNSNEIRKLG